MAVGVSMRKLSYSNGSPFARKVRIVLYEKGIEYEHDVDDRVRSVEEIELVSTRGGSDRASRGR